MNEDLMQENGAQETATPKGKRWLPPAFWCVVLPLLIAAAVLVATVLISGSTLIPIEDITINRILAGTYGTPDWRVQEMNPLLAQFLTLLYRVLPFANWYGILLLALLLASAAAVMGLAARKRGGLLPAAILLSPIVLLLTNSMHATAVCALCAGVGSLLIMDSLPRGKGRSTPLIAGIALFLFAVMLSLKWAVLLAAAAALCALPHSHREGRLKGIIFGVAFMAVASLALHGYTALMYSAPELAAYRSEYAAYERLQHSSLKAEADSLISQYGTKIYSDGAHEEDHDHEEAQATDPVDIQPHVFDVVGWTLNDVSLFFARYGSDTELTDPQALRVLIKSADTFSLSPGRLFPDLFATLKKPQFLLLIAMLVVTAIGVVLTSRRKGLIALFAVLFALCGHIGAIASYYSSFAEIAPFYLLPIVALLYHFNGEDAIAFARRLVRGRLPRLAAACLALIVFAAGMAGFYYYTNTATASAGSSYTAYAVGYIRNYVEAHPDVLFIGDNPSERQKPETLGVPVRGQDQNLLAGTYDLYSPRAAALMEKYGMTNPLKDCLDREDIAYMIMSYDSVNVSIRLAEAYGIYDKQPPEDLLSYAQYTEKIVRMSAYTPEEVEALLNEIRHNEEQAAMWGEALMQLQEEGFFDEPREGSEAGAEPAGEPNAEAAAEPAGEPAAEPAGEPAGEPAQEPKSAPPDA